MIQGLVKIIQTKDNKKARQWFLQPRLVYDRTSPWYISVLVSRMNIVLCILVSVLTQSSASKPNILFILADDLGDALINKYKKLINRLNSNLLPQSLRNRMMLTFDITNFDYIVFLNIHILSFSRRITSFLYYYLN